MTRRFVPVAIVTFAVTAAGSTIRAADWRPAGLQGMTVRTLAPAGDRLCAGTAGRGVFCLAPRAANAGWRHVGLDGVTVTDLWIDAARPDVMFAATDGAFDLTLMFRTLDGGRTWEPIGAGVPFPSTGVRRMSVVSGVPGSGTVFAGGGAVWRSDDLGDTWREVLDVAYQGTLEAAPTDASTIWTGGQYAFTFAPASYMAVTRDGGAAWSFVWSSGPFDFSNVWDIAPHPRADGLALSGHDGFVLRTEEHGAAFRKVLEAPVQFLTDWSLPHPEWAIAAGATLSTALGPARAFVSRDRGVTWGEVGARNIATLRIHDVAADARRAGLAWAATNDGVHAFYGGGRPLCHDARAGVDETRLWDEVCPPIMAPGPVRLGDAVVADASALRLVDGRVDLGDVECIIEGSDVAFATIDPPDPPPGAALLILAREEGALDYGKSSDGAPRVAASGDCR